MTHIFVTRMLPAQRKFRIENLNRGLIIGLFKHGPSIKSAVRNTNPNH